MSVSLRFKLVGGAVLTSLLVLVIGLIGVWNGNQLGGLIEDLGHDDFPSVAHLLAAESALQSLATAQRTLLNPDLTPEQRDTAHDDFFTQRESYRASLAEYDNLPRSAEEDRLYNYFLGRVEAWAEVNNRFFAVHDAVVATSISNPTDMVRRIEGFIGDHYKTVLHASESIEEGVAMTGGGDPTACRFGQWVTTAQVENPELAALILSSQDPHNAYHEAVRNIANHVDDGHAEDAREVLRHDMKSAMHQVFADLESMRDIAADAMEQRTIMAETALTECAALQEESFTALGSLVEFVRHEAENDVVVATQTEGRAAKVMLATMIGGSLIALIVGVLFSRQLVRRIQNAISRMSQGSDHVSSTSSQVAGSSQGLAEGASEQASSLEEISASLEEMTAMTTQNAENAGRANEVAGDVSANVESGISAMERMDGAMNEIKTSADQTANIIKTIDEIAFQTNILALNAAVEAARAGEAGQGFAVVAEEVRSLAQRSAASARDTAALINQAQNNAANGVAMGEEVSATLNRVVEAAGEMARLIGEVSTASSEQAQGITQVTSAVAQMDGVTQQNAANAEEMAAAAEEMTAQSREMEGLVGDLVDLVHGHSRHDAPKVPQLTA